MIEILQNSLIIALFCVSWDILLTYEPNEPKKNQMLLYLFRKMVYDYEERVRKRFQITRAEITSWWNEAKTAVYNGYTCGDDPEPYRKQESKVDIQRDKEFERLNQIEQHVTSWIFYLKPILTCKYCFPSFYGTIIFIMLNGFHVEQWAIWLLSIVCSVILVGIISGIHEKLIK